MLVQVTALKSQSQLSEGMTGATQVKLVHCIALHCIALLGCLPNSAVEGDNQAQSNTFIFMCKHAK